MKRVEKCHRFCQLRRKSPEHKSESIHPRQKYFKVILSGQVTIFIFMDIPIIILKPANDKPLKVCAFFGI